MNLISSWVAADIGCQRLKLVRQGDKVWDVDIPISNIKGDSVEEEGERLYTVLRWGLRRDWGWFLRHIICRLVVTYPPGTDEKLRQEWQRHLSLLGMAQLKMVDASLAAAAGSGEAIDTLACRGVLSMGASSSWFAVYALGELVAYCELPLGGWHFNEAIRSFIKTRDRLDIPVSEAERVRLQMGSFQFGSDCSELVLKGTYINSGIEKNVTLHDTELCELLQDCLEPLLWSIRGTMRNLPPEMLVDLSHHPLHLVGGMARTAGLATFLEKQLHLPVKSSTTPEHTVVLGALKLAANRYFKRQESC